MACNVFIGITGVTNVMRSRTISSTGGLIIVAMTLVFVPMLFAAEDPYYRYKNDKGGLVINDRLPPEAIVKGYDIISRDGMLIKRVPRQLTEEERRLNNTQEAKDQQRAAEEHRLRAWDESLLLRYSGLVDIEAARDRASRDLTMRINILKGNRAQLKLKIEQELGRAANVERAGGVVPGRLIDKIALLRLEVKNTEASIAAREKEMSAIRASFQRDIERFSTLIDRAELRGKSRQVKPIP